MRDYTIVIIEDDKRLAASMKDLIEIHADAEVMVCHDMEQAQTALEASEPNAVLLDLHLPDSCGKKTVEAIREMTTAPIVVLTGDELPERQTRGWGISYFIKPDAMGAVDAVAAAMLNKHYGVTG